MQDTLALSVDAIATDDTVNIAEEGGTLGEQRVGEAAGERRLHHRLSVDAIATDDTSSTSPRKRPGSHISGTTGSEDTAAARRGDGAGTPPT